MPKKYRILQNKEIIQEGDQIDSCSDSWKDFPIWKDVSLSLIGKTAPDPQYPAHTIFRREIK